MPKQNFISKFLPVAVIGFIIYKIYENYSLTSSQVVASDIPRYNYSGATSPQTSAPIYVPPAIKTVVVNQRKPTVQEVLNVTRNTAKVQASSSGVAIISPPSPVNNKIAILPIQQQKGIDINNMLDYYSKQDLSNPVIKAQFDATRKVYGLA